MGITLALINTVWTFRSKASWYIYTRHLFLPAEIDGDAHSRFDALVSSPSFSTITVGMNDLDGPLIT